MGPGRAVKLVGPAYLNPPRGGSSREHGDEDEGGNDARDEVLEVDQGSEPVPYWYEAVILQPHLPLLLSTS